MDEEKKIILDAFKELGVKDILPQIYTDLLQPAVKESGRNLLTVAKAISIAFSPLKGAIWGYEKIHDWILIKLTEKLSKTPPEKIQSPRMNVAGQILINLPFFKDESELREMFANLLASAMNKEKANSAHPSYVTIIQQLSSDEAKILNWIAHNRMGGRIAFEIINSQGTPLNGYDWIENQFIELCRLSAVSNLDLSDAYLENLERLNILKESTWSEPKYIPEHADSFGDYGPSVEQETQKELNITEFGKKFLITCVID